MHADHNVVNDGGKTETIALVMLGPALAEIRAFDRAEIVFRELIAVCERNDDRLPRGERVLSQRGVPGFKLTRYRILRQGDQAVRERWTDVYPPTTQIVRVGTGTMPKGSVRCLRDF